MATPIPPNRATFTARAIAGATNAVRSTFRGPDHAVVGVTSDSRAVVPGCAFVALRGEHHDGHGFAKAAVASGASLVVAEEGRGEGLEPADVIEVRDTLVAWGDLARAHLHQWRHAAKGGRTVAITGSAGKTTTKELCAALLATEGDCHFTPGNLNNRIGLPAVVLGMEPHHRFGVFEMGMSVPGEIAAMASILEPNVAVITNVGIAHAEGVGGTREAVGREKGALLASLDPSAIVVVNADDEIAMKQTERTLARRIEPFGRGKGARYALIERISRGASGSRVRIGRPDGTEIEADFPFVGEAAAIDLVAAFAAAEGALLRAIDPAKAQAALSKLSRPAGRGAVRALADNTCVLDDTYNANPDSMRAALASLAEIAAPDRRRMVAVLGEMRELGGVAEAEHASLGDAIANTGVAVAISCGGLMDRAIDRAAAAGVSVHRAASSDEAAAIALREVKAGDAVLVKGSRSIATERVVEALLASRGGAP